MNTPTALTALTRTLLILGVSGLLGCSGGDSIANPPAPPAPPNANSVSVRDNFFTPTPARIPAGTTVTWTWQGSNPHNVTFDPAGAPSSPTQTTGAYSRQFATAGTHSYYCTVHGRAMSGSVAVE